MALYIKVTATAIIKIQDPYNTKEVEKLQEATVIDCPAELTEENYDFEIVDVD